MSEVLKIATRDSYGDALVSLGKTADNLVVLDADLSQATKTCKFKNAFPQRHFNCGIAEANMVTVAAGMAAEGFVPFVSTFAMFAAGRAYEQIRNSIAYPRLNVKIGATHGGISVGEDGASHQCSEDFALMRVIPNMTVLSPSDDIEAKAVVEAAYQHQGPVYIRFGRLPVPVFHRDTYNFKIGKGEQLCNGTDFTIIATGLMVYRALVAAKKLRTMGINIRVINMATIKPLDKDIILKAAEETKGVLVIEEHSVIGGLGEAVSRVLVNSSCKAFLQMGIDDVFGHSGTAEELLEEFDLTSNSIVNKIYQYTIRP